MNAIMVIENISRHREMGKNAVNGSLDGAREITFSALAATVAIIAIFLPVRSCRELSVNFLPSLAWPSLWRLQFRYLKRSHLRHANLSVYRQIEPQELDFSNE